MAPAKPSSPLDTLQLMINEVLVQTGKALRASSNDGQRDLAPVQASLNSKVPEAMETFHYALDDLESDIVRAKAALMRDLDRLRVKRMPPKEPAPVEAQSRSPIAIDIDSPQDTASDLDLPQRQATPLSITSMSERDSQSMAPIPDMGISIPSPTLPASSTNFETTTPAPQAPMGPASASEDSPSLSAGNPEPRAATVSEGPPSGAPEAPMSDVFDLQPSGNTAGDATNAELNFTDMMFSLAPGSNDLQQHSQAPEPDFDLTTLGPADSTGGLLSLDNMMPGDAGGQPSSSMIPVADPASSEIPAEKKPEKEEMEMDDLFDMEMNTGGDSMELDLNLEGSGDQNSFDDLFYENNMEMQHGEFDDAFFGLE